MALKELAHVAPVPLPATSRNVWTSWYLSE